MIINTHIEIPGCLVSYMRIEVTFVDVELVLCSAFMLNSVSWHRRNITTISSKDHNAIFEKNTVIKHIKFTWF